METYTFIKRTLASIILCFSLFTSAQSEKLEKLNQSDTIYIYISKSKNANRISNSRTNADSFDYFLLFEVKDLPNQYVLLANHHSFALNKKVCKDFLKKNKNIIVDIAYLKELGYDAAEKLLISKKQLYVIDDKDVGWFTLKLREVKMANKRSLISIE